MSNGNGGSLTRAGPRETSRIEQASVLKHKVRNRAMSLIGPETSEYRRSDQAVLTGEMPHHCYLGRRWVLPWIKSCRSSRPR